MALLGQLGIIERLARGLEIGAAILLIAVEKERIESAVEVVVMRNVVARARSKIELLQAAEQVAYEPRQRPIRYGNGLLTQQHCDHVSYRALLDDEAAVHVRLAEL